MRRGYFKVGLHSSLRHLFLASPVSRKHYVGSIELLWKHGSRTTGEADEGELGQAASECGRWRSQVCSRVLRVPLACAAAAVCVTAHRDGTVPRRLGGLGALTSLARSRYIPHLYVWMHVSPTAQRRLMITESDEGRQAATACMRTA